MRFLRTSTYAVTLALGVFAGASFVPSANAHEQPQMQSALEHLKAAKNALEAASHDHGGHREKALSATNTAIREVKEGIEFAEKHHDKPGHGPEPKPPNGPEPKPPTGPTPKGTGPTPK
jgi:hypothetical protein